MMKILNDIREMYDDATQRVSKLVGQRVCMRACMMGPRAVGKTTILTSIFHNTSESISQTKLKFVPDNDTLARMSKCKRELEQIFEKRIAIEDRPSAGIESTPHIHVFHYEFGLKGKKTSVDLDIKDFPGEFVNGGLHSGEVDKFIRESNAIFIAIDTPHLMENDGMYNDAKNKCKLICDYFDNNITDTDEKLILLVPLKCEKYYFEGHINEVNQKVKDAYAPLLSKIRNFSCVACAITPILTIGGVEFDSFMKDSEGRILEDPTGLPEAAFYKFRGDDAELKPMFCVQPLYYILSYITNAYEKNKSDGNTIKQIFNGLFNLFSSDIDLYQAMKDVSRFMIRDNNGYEIIQGAELFNQ